jgi:O-antigen/teichoic acid export membrane protein
MAVKRNILANYFGAGWTALMTLAFIPLYVRYLGVEAYGLIGLFAMLQGWLLLLDLGMAPAISREMARFDGRAGHAQSLRNLLRSAEAIALVLAVVIAGSFWLASGWLATRWLSPRAVPASVVVQSLSIMGSVIGLRIVENLYRSTLIGLQRQVPLNAINASVATFRGLGAVVVLAFVSPTLQAYFLWQGTVSLLSVAALALAAYRVIPVADAPGTFSMQALRGVWRFATGTVAITFLSLLLTNVDKILLSRLLSLEDFGYYAFAIVVANTPLALVAPIAQAVYPRFTQLISGNQQADLAAAYHATAQLVAVLLGSATCVLVLLGQQILELWTGNPALAARTSPLIVVLSLGSLLNGLMTIPYYLQLSAGWTSLAVRANLVAILLVIPALLVVVPRHGAVGAAWTWLALNAFLGVVVIPRLHRRLLPAEAWRWCLRDVAFPLLAALSAAGVLHVLLGLAPDVRRNVVAWVASAALVTLAAALAAPDIRARVAMVLRGRQVRAE